MKCPVDKSLMIVVEHRRVELDYCIRCSGIWLDHGELELLIALLVSEGARTPSIEPDKTSGKEKRKCPVCGRKMDIFRIGKEHRVLIDCCPLEHGLWFDAGELQRVLREIVPPESPASQEVIDFLGDALSAAYKRDAVT